MASTLSTLVVSTLQQELVQATMMVDYESKSTLSVTKPNKIR